jgi:hypothetical protein
MRSAALPIATVLASLLLAGPVARAQDAEETAATDDADAPTLTLIDETPLASPRAAAMGGALVTTADDLDATFANPAGIGGLNWKEKSVPWARKLYFPYVSVAANQNSAGLYHEYREQQGQSDSAVGRAIANTHEGERQYGRTNLALGLVFGRTIVVPFQDMQLAATKHAGDADAIDVRYRSMSGIGYGFSAQDPEGRISLGYFGYTATRKETEGEFAYQDFIDKAERSSAIADNSTTYTGVGHNVGGIFRLAKTAKPTLGLALKNAGDTTFKGGGDALVLKQDLSAGFSLTPMLGKIAHLHVVLEADRLLDDAVAFTKKYRFGTELALGGFGSYATLALRGGYNDAGPSGGVMLNLGLLGLEASTYGVDLGSGNEKVIERRYMGSVVINVAEF